MIELFFRILITAGVLACTAAAVTWLALAIDEWWMR